MSDERVVPRHEVTQALAAGTAVVALESTVIAQGLPWPDNLETARAVMVAVREAGAVPAMIAVLDGVIRIGLDDSEIELIARSAASDHGIMTAIPCSENGGRARPELAKANRRNLAAVVAGGRSAATTVSATVWITRRFGLEPRVMATGGLGGVHIEASATFDVSTDLDELARADGTLVVCSGFKSILDVSASLEALETRGVLVVGFGTDLLPGFFTQFSGLRLEHRVDTPAAAAAVVRAHCAIGLPGAIVLAQPVPAADSLDDELLGTTLDRAQRSFGQADQG